MLVCFGALLFIHQDFFLNFWFDTGVELINNVALVSGVPQSDSVMHIPVSVLSQILFPFGLLHYIEQSSLCYTVGPCWLSVLNIAVIACQPQLQIYLFLFPVVKITWFSWLDMLYILWSNAHLDRVFSSVNLLFHVWWVLWLILKHQCYLQCCNPS